LSEEEYITDENDPHSVETITENDYTIPSNEETVEFDETLASVQVKLSNFKEYDKKMEAKLVESIQKGELE